MTQVSEDLMPVLGTEVEKQQALAQAAIASECKVAALLKSLEQAELTAQLARIDAFFADGFVTGEDIWWHDTPRGGYGAFSPVKAVYIGKCGNRAGIAVALKTGQWLPKVVSLSKISSRLDD